MKKILFLIFCLLLSGCNVIFQPVQEARESTEYLRIYDGAVLIQKIPNIKYKISGLVFLYQFLEST